MSRILGIDCDSRKIAMVCMDMGGHIKYHIILISKSDTAKERLPELINMFNGQLKVINPDHVYIEDSIFIQNYRTSKTISEIIGNIKYSLKDYDYVTVPVTTWKKGVIGKGNANKDDVKVFILKKYPELEGELQDIIDATAICLYGIKCEKGKIKEEY